MQLQDLQGIIIGRHNHNISYEVDTMLKSALSDLPDKKEKKEWIKEYLQQEFRKYGRQLKRQLLVWATKRGRQSKEKYRHLTISGV